MNNNIIPTRKRIYKLKTDKVSFRHHHVYGRAGDLVRLISDKDDVCVVEHTQTKERFPIHRSYITYYEQ